MSKNKKPLSLIDLAKLDAKDFLKALRKGENTKAEIAKAKHNKESDEEE